MNILAFESSCDETAVAVVRDGRTLLSDAILSQADMHALYGGVVPEIASRKHVQAIAALTDKALADAGLTKKDIDAVAVTYAPGLIGAVLVGVNFAKAAALALARQVAMYIARETTNLSYKAIGESFGKDHTTVLHNVRCIENFLRDKPYQKELVDDIIKNLKSDNTAY